MSLSIGANVFLMMILKLISGVFWHHNTPTYGLANCIEAGKLLSNLIKLGLTGAQICALPPSV